MPVNVLLHFANILDFYMVINYGDLRAKDIFHNVKIKIS